MESQFQKNNASIDDISVEVGEIFEYSINHLRDNDADIEVEFNLQIEAELTEEDYNEAFYDKEDGTWYFVNVSTDKIYSSSIVNAILTVEFNPPAGPEHAYVKIKSINNENNLVTD